MKFRQNDETADEVEIVRVRQQRSSSCFQGVLSADVLYLELLFGVIGLPIENR